MKIIFVLLLIIPLMNISCVKKSKKFRYRGVGYIYNSLNSTPFTNTQFKVFNYIHATYTKQEAFFYTDSKGAFDVTSDFGGVLAWPSYI